jgi:proline iminopeptidase
MKKSLFLLAVLTLGLLFSNAQVRHIITSDGVDLYVTVKGKGTPCLYIHGGPGSGSYWLEKFMGDSLEKHFQMIYLDQRGVGRSTSPKNKDFSMDRMTKDFEEVRKALGIKQWLTLGHSFGGLLMMGYVERYPQSIEGMMMINCTLNLPLIFKTSWCPKACEFLGITDRSYFENDSIPLLTRWGKLGGLLDEKGLRWKMAYSNPKNEDIMDSTYKLFPNWNSDFGSVAATMKDYLANFLPASKNVTIPVLFYYGKKDNMVGSEHYKLVKFPNMLLWGGDVGHMPFQENQADLMKAITSYQNKYHF